MLFTNKYDSYGKKIHDCDLIKVSFIHGMEKVYVVEWCHANSGFIIKPIKEPWDLGYSLAFLESDRIKKFEVIENSNMITTN